MQRTTKRSTKRLDSPAYCKSYSWDKTAEKEYLSIPNIAINYLSLVDTEPAARIINNIFSYIFIDELESKTPYAIIITYEYEPGVFDSISSLFPPDAFINHEIIVSKENEYIKINSKNKEIYCIIKMENFRQGLFYENTHLPLLFDELLKKVNNKEILSKIKDGKFDILD